LGAHCLEFDARGIEGSSIVRQPHVFQFVFPRSGLARQAGPKYQSAQVPTHALVRREYTPSHRGKAIGKERRGQAHDTMVGFVPRHKPFFRITLALSESDKRPHLVNVAVDLFLPRACEVHIFVRDDSQQVRFSMCQTPEYLVEQVPPTAIAVARNEFRQFQESSRHPRRGRRILRSLVDCKSTGTLSKIKLGLLLPFVDPYHVLRADAELEQVPSSISPLTEVSDGGSLHDRCENELLLRRIKTDR
jgi:hypothetical protein